MDGGHGSPSRSGSAVAVKKARPLRQVGIVCHGDGGVKADYQIKLYLLDIDPQEQDYALVNPALRFRFPHRETTLAVCLLKSNSNSTVYMFGGYNPYPRNPCRPKDKYAAKYELPDKVINNPDGDLQVKTEELLKLRPMYYIKGKPIAIPTPDAKKILVFETCIRAVKTYRAFELYDPQDNSWELLPELPAYCSHTQPEAESEPEPEAEAEPDSESVQTSDSEAEERDYYLYYCSCFIVVSSYSFIDDSHFFVETEENGSFILDLNARKWTRVLIRLVPNPNRSYDIVPFVTANAQYAFTPDGSVLGLGDGGFLSERATVKSSEDLKLSAFAHHPSNKFMLISLFPSVLPLPPFINGQVCTTCFLQPQMDLSSKEIRMLIDVCHTNLTTLDSEVSKCVKLRTKFRGYVYEFNLISV